eukprot:946375-Prymnesium_polylepis.1
MVGWHSPRPVAVASPWTVSQKCQPEGGAAGVSPMGVGGIKGAGGCVPDAPEFERAPRAADRARPG